MRLQVINKDIKPFQREFYNSFNLTNLPRGNLQLNGGGLPGGQLAQGAIVRGAIGTVGNYPGCDCLGASGMGVNCPRGIVSGVISWGQLSRMELP